MTDNTEFSPDDIQALLEWLRADTRRGSPRELQARRTLARMLRSSKPLAPGLRFILAEAVDPDGEDGTQLLLKRKQGRPRRINQRHVAAFIYQKTKAGVSVESAVKEAEDKFGVGSSTAYDAWAKWRPDFERDPELARI